jgi:cytochrome c-type biogenesis protein
LLLFVYGLGLGVPFLAAGIWFPSVMSATRLLRDRWALVTRVSGAVLIVAGVLLASGRLTDISTRLAG